MNISMRRAVAILGGLAIPVGALFWSYVGVEYAQTLFRHTHDVASVVGSDAMYKDFGDGYILYAKYGLYLATGLCFALIFWDPRPPGKRVSAVFWIFLAVALPVTVLNYHQSDIFVSRTKQAVIDVVIVFLGTVCSVNLAAMRPVSVPARIMQLLSLFFIVFQCVLVPLVFAVLWSLNWERAISLADTRSFAPGWVSAFAGLGSLAVSALQYRRTSPPTPR